MKSRVVGILLASLFLLSSSVGAANWIYLQRLEGTRYGACTEYLDTESVVRKQDRVHYWTLWILDDKQSSNNIKKMLRKNVGVLGDTLQTRFLEYYQYDVDDKEVFRYVNTADSFFKEPSGSSGEFAVQRALEYVKGNGELFSGKPKDLSVSGPRWFGSRAFDEFDLQWDIRSITAYPRNKPETVEIMVKWIWNEKGLVARQAYLGALQPSAGQVYQHIKSTNVNYRFQVAQNKMMILSISDYDANNQRLHFAEVYKWQDIEPGSQHEAARQIAIQWINDPSGDDPHLK